MTTELQTVETSEAKPKRTAKRRGRGEGGIRERGDGRWEATIAVGCNGSGKRIRRSVYGKSKREVQDKLSKLQGLKTDGLLFAPSKMTVATFLARWLDDVVRLSRKPLTHASYRNIVENHINKRIGGESIDRITAARLQAFYSDMERAGTSPRMRQYVHAVLHRAFRQAVKWGLLAVNVCDRLDRPTVPEREMKVLSPDQAKAFMVSAESDRLHALYVLASTTGLRQGELYGLKWEDVDLDGGYLSVQRTIIEIDGVVSEGAPKTKKGKRRADLPAIAVEALEDHRRRMLAEGHAGSTYIFCDTTGGPLRRQNVLRRSFRPILKAAELPQIRFHDLRHTCATWLFSMGIHAKVVQERLGHSKIGITLDTYSHVLPTMQGEAAAAFDSAIGPRPARVG
jgi:integrase